MTYFIIYLTGIPVFYYLLAYNKYQLTLKLQLAKVYIDSQSELDFKAKFLEIQKKFESLSRLKGATIGHAIMWPVIMFTILIVLSSTKEIKEQAIKRWEENKDAEL